MGIRGRVHRTPLLVALRVCEMKALSNLAGVRYAAPCVVRFLVFGMLGNLRNVARLPEFKSQRFTFLVSGGSGHADVLRNQTMWLFTLVVSTWQCRAAKNSDSHNDHILCSSGFSHLILWNP